MKALLLVLCLMLMSMAPVLFQSKCYTGPDGRVVCCDRYGLCL